MVASPVYGIEPLLDQIYAMLQGYGYRVWMSHKGTVPTNPTMFNEGNCLGAVERCDLFLGIITGRYGSGIFHNEVRHAVRCCKPRWFLAHHDVVVARHLLKQFRFDARGRRKRLRFRVTPVLESTKVIEIYECAIQQDRPLDERQGNWVQEYFHNDDALRFVDAQFADAARILALLKTQKEET